MRLPGLRRSPKPAGPLPDPAKPPQNRGEWGDAALVNVDITELVKAQIHTRTRPWNK